MVGERYPETTFFIASPNLDVDRRDRRRRPALRRRRRPRRLARGRQDETGDAVFGRPHGEHPRRGRSRGTRNGRASDGECCRRRRPAAEAATDRYWTELRHGATLGGEVADGRTAEDLGRLNDLLRWYPVDAMVHFTTPHGLEQYSGAAWAVRDVTQGPVEFLVATGNPGPVRDILRVVYEHQDRATGDWPQWFMFDRYRGDPGARQPRRHHPLADQGAVRLHRDDRRHVRPRR